MTTGSDDKHIKNISDLLKEQKAKKVSAQKVTLAASETREKLEEKIESIKVKELEDAAQKEAASLGVPYINLVGFPISDVALTAIEKEIAKKHQVVCFLLEEKEIRIGSPNPENPELQPLLESLIDTFTYKGHGDIYLISQHSFDIAYALYDKFPGRRKQVAGVEIRAEELAELQKNITSFGRLNALLNEETNMSSIVTILLAGALQSDASDIHLEAEEEEIVIRYRIDGVLHIVGKLPSKYWRRLDARVKTLAKLKINITSQPQDGRITLFLSGGEKMDIRVSTLPTSFGESIVLRLLHSKVSELSFDDLGMRGKQYEDLKREIERPTGMIVTTGPTGSGKTTTLYAIVNKLNDEETKIITLEDPIEYKLKGIAQSQVDPSKGYTFAEGLRSILRQDPDIILVGELRDLETVEVAIQAALTGHKVLSTIHTNDAAGAIPRFLSMGTKPFLLAPALNAVIGQRLVRRVHDACKIEQEIDKETMERVKKVLSDLPKSSGYTIDISKLKFYRGQGCEACNFIGLKGRIGIYELFTITEEINKEILSGVTDEYKVARLAHEAGMITMVQDGLLKALDGVTTVEEVFRVAE